VRARLTGSRLGVECGAREVLTSISIVCNVPRRAEWMASTTMTNPLPFHSPKRSSGSLNDPTKCDVDTWATGAQRRVCRHVVVAILAPEPGHDDLGGSLVNHDVSTVRSKKCARTKCRVVIANRLFTAPLANSLIVEGESVSTTRRSRLRC